MRPLHILCKLTAWHTMPVSHTSVCCCFKLASLANIVFVFITACPPNACMCAQQHLTFLILQASPVDFWSGWMLVQTLLNRATSSPWRWCWLGTPAPINPSRRDLRSSLSSIPVTLRTLGIIIPSSGLLGSGPSTREWTCLTDWI